MNELSDNAKKIFKDLYCLTGEKVKDAYKRVSKEFVKKDGDEELAYELLESNTWRPNTPVWLNAGSKHKIFSACFVVNLEDSMNSIYDVANVSRNIFQYGAGVGIPIGKLRERNADIFEGNPEEAPEGKSSGPVTFLKLYDAVGESTKSGGRVRRAAILCSLPVDHPDILEYITCKQTDGSLSNMNISVNITDKFMQALEDNIPFDLMSVSNKGEVKKTINASDLWDSFAQMNWKTADPGIIFIDNMNKFNPLKSIMPIDVTNPCITGDTLVSTLDGQKRIDELIYGEYVYTYDIENSKKELEPVVFVEKTRRDVDVVELELEDGETLRLTPDHEVYTENRGYITASNLNTEDVVLTIE